jgi:outer membrane protein TolC
MLNRVFFLLICILCLPCLSLAQLTDTTDQSKGLPESTPDVSPLYASNDTTHGERLTLQQCISYGLKNQPALKQSYIDEAIAKTNNAINLSIWLPQVNGSANVEHYFQLPVTFIPGTNGVLEKVSEGLYNTSDPSVTATQTIFSPDVLFAARTAKYNTLLARQNTAGTKIDLVSDISLAFYDLLLTVEQISVLREDTARLNKNLSDTYHQYVSGVADKVDYKQATISLNNSLAQLKTSIESLQAKYATLKQLMGYPTDKSFIVQFDTTQMMQEIYFDTTEQLEFEKRIEYQQLMTTKRLQRETTAYYQLDFLPSLSAFYNYNQEYESNELSNLYAHAYPYSLFGLQLDIPIFTGFRRTENVHKAQLQEQRTDWDEVNLKHQIYTEYKQALADYNSNTFDLKAMEDNVEMAREVYNIVKLQYRQGIKPYLDVITAESDLRTSEINYLNALFNVLSSKINLEKAMGDINPNT